MRMSVGRNLFCCLLNLLVKSGFCQFGQRLVGLLEATKSFDLSLYE
jgi:hypothetical protein